MSTLIMDGFDNYNVQTDLWDFAGTDCGIDLTGTHSRTGVGCLQVQSAAFGPRTYFAHMTHLLACIAWDCSQGGECMRFLNTDNVGAGPSMVIEVLGDGSLRFVSDGGVIMGPTAPGLVVFNSYNSIAIEINGFGVLNGVLDCWVNGVHVFNGTGRTGELTHPYCNGWQLMGPGGIPAHCYIDDVYLLDCTVGTNVTFLGALKLYTIVPTANAAPVQWTPLAGQNFQNVNEVPPDGDTSYNSSATVGQVDQYLYPLTGVPANSQIFMVAHELDMRVDAGSRSVASDFNGIVSPAAAALTNGYHIYQTPYDVNPGTSAQFVAGDFPVNAGPVVTA